MPSGKVATPSVDQNSDGTVSIKYQPSEVGLHELDVFYNGQAIQVINLCEIMNIGFSAKTYFF